MLPAGSSAGQGRALHSAPGTQVRMVLNMGLPAQARSRLRWLACCRRKVTINAYKGKHTVSVREVRSFLFELAG